MKSYVFSAKTKEITLKLIQIKAKFTFFNRHGLMIFFFLLWFLGFSKALTNWVKTQNYKLENMRLIRKTFKKKTNRPNKKTRISSTTFGVCKNGLRRMACNFQGLAQLTIFLGMFFVIWVLFFFGIFFMFFMFKICVNEERDKYHFLILFLLHFCSIFCFGRRET